MLDRADAELDAAPDRLRGVGMGHDVGPPGGRFPDDGPDLLLGVLQVPDRIRRRGDPARGHDLDLGGTLAQLVPRRPPHLGDAVGDSLEAGAPQAAEAEGVGLQVAEIGVAAGLGQRPARIEDPGPTDQVGLGRAGQTVVAAAGIADRREAPLQSALEDQPGVLVDQGARHRADLGDIDVYGDGVEMGVDQTGHQGSPAEVDHPRLAGPDPAVGNLLDPIALDQDGGPLQRFRRNAVEEARVGEEDLCRHLPLLFQPPKDSSRLGRSPRRYNRT